MRRNWVATHRAIKWISSQRIRDCFLDECNVAHVLVRNSIEKQTKNKQCDTCISNLHIKTCRARRDQCAPGDQPAGPYRWPAFSARQFGLLAPSATQESRAG